MPSDQLVLLKSRTQRWAEMLILPAIVLPVGPVLRAMLGDAYSLFYGLFAGLVLILLVSTLAHRWAARHGGEWVTESDRLRRALADAAGRSRWPFALVMGLMIALFMLAMLLIIEPLDEFGGVFGGAPIAVGVIVAVSALAAGQGLRAGRSLDQPTVADEARTADHSWSEVCRVLPWTGLAWAIGASTGLAVALQFDGATRFGSYLAVCLAVSLILRQLFLRRQGATRADLTTTHATLGRDMLLGTAAFGVPLGLVVSGLVVLQVLETMDAPGATAALERTGMSLPMVIGIGVAGAILLGALVGLARGASLHLVRRLADPHQSR